jgi:hypothetical protein
MIRQLPPLRAASEPKVLADRGTVESATICKLPPWKRGLGPSRFRGICNDLQASPIEVSAVSPLELAGKYRPRRSASVITLKPFG